MANTYTLIGSPIVVGSGGASSISFTSIPNTYTDLVVKMSLRVDATTYNEYGFTIAFNGSSANYSFIMLRGDGSGTPGSYNYSTYGYNMIGYIPSSKSTSTANTFTNTEFYIPNYAGSNKKSLSIDTVEEQNQTTDYININAGLWSDTSGAGGTTPAITSLTFTPLSSNFVQYSTFYLYGISNS